VFVPETDSTRHHAQRALVEVCSLQGEAIWREGSDTMMGADLTYLGIVGALTFSASWDRVQPVFHLPGGLGFLAGYAASRSREAGLAYLRAGSRGWPVILRHCSVVLTVGRLVKALALPGLPLVGTTPDPARINAHRH
jgi:hypothetical protein